MGKYVRRTRPGVMLYHEDMAYLTALADNEIASIIRYLAQASSLLAQDTRCPTIPAMQGFAAITCKNMLEKLQRDHEKYLKTCEGRSSHNNAKGDLSKTEEAKGDFGILTDRSCTESVSECIPSISDIIAFCNEQDIKMDAQRFYDYYSMKGWPISDWKAAVRYWASTDKKNAGNQMESQSESNWLFT